MHSKEHAESSSPQKKYHLDRSWHTRLSGLTLLITLVAFGIFASILVFPNLWIVYPLFACLPFLGFAVLLVIVIVVNRYVMYAHLTTTDEGIEYNTSFGYSIYTSWKDIKQIDQIKFGFWTVEGIILHESEVRGRRWSNWYHWRKKYDHIPITPFVENWQSMELGYYLNRYIGLKDNKEGTMETNEQVEREDREEKRRKIQETQNRIRKVIYIGVGIFLIIACLWGFITSLLNP